MAASSREARASGVSGIGGGRRPQREAKISGALAAGRFEMVYMDAVTG
jgi:hypothetical protein